MLNPTIINRTISDGERTILDKFNGSHDYRIDKIERRSQREYDISIEGKHYFDSPTKPGERVEVGFSAWLPLMCIRDLLNWCQWDIAEMTSYPSMTAAGDWSGVRDSEPEYIWEIFEKYVPSLFGF